MKILVTGAAGFIGSHVVERLVSLGHDVMILDNLSTGRIENLETVLDKIKGHYCDIVNLGELDSCLNQWGSPDAIIHLAAQAAITTALKNPFRDLEVNGIGTLNMLRLAESYHVKKFVYASTSAVYGDKWTGQLKEGMPKMPDNYYGISKLTGEYYVRIANMDTTILRLGNVYGPRQVPIGENQVVPRMIKHLLDGDEFFIFGDGRQRRDFVYVKDAARAFTMAVEAQGGIYNIATGHSVEVNWIANFLAPDHQWQYDLSRIDQRTNVQMDISEATMRLGWTPWTKAKDGLQETMEWWKSCQKEHSS